MISYRATSILTVAAFALLTVAPYAFPPAADSLVDFNCMSMFIFYGLLQKIVALTTLGTTVTLVIEGLRERQASRWFSSLGIIAFGMSLYLFRWELNNCTHGLNLTAPGILYLRHLIPFRNHRNSTAVYTV